MVNATPLSVDTRVPHRPPGARGSAKETPRSNSIVTPGGNSATSGGTAGRSARRGGGFRRFKLNEVIENVFELHKARVAAREGRD